MLKYLKEAIDVSLEHKRTSEALIGIIDAYW